MPTITIEYYGHSCFKVNAEEKSILFDPYKDNSVPGLKLPNDMKSDAVYCSHTHDDHCGAEKIDIQGKSDPFTVTYLCVPHDDAEGTLRGMNNITMIKIGRCTIAHLGDIGRLPTAGEYFSLKKADVIMIPVGGHFTIDAAQAKEIISNLKTKLNILMHYRTEESGYDVLADIEEVKKTFPELKELHESSITFEDTSVPKETIILHAIQ